MPFTKPDVNTVWASTGTSVAPTVSKIEQGWVSEIPTYENFNFILNRQDEFNAHVNQYGVAVWDSTTAYIANKSYVQGSDGNIYKALTSNTNSDPTTAGTVDWARAFNNYDYSYSKAATDGKYLQISKNLSDVNAPTARANLGIAFANDSVAKAGTDITQYINAHGLAAFVGQSGLGKSASQVLPGSGTVSLDDYYIDGHFRFQEATYTAAGGTQNLDAFKDGQLTVINGNGSDTTLQIISGHSNGAVMWRSFVNGNNGSPTAASNPFKSVWDSGNFNPDSKLDATGKAVDSNKLNGQLASYYWSQGNFNPANYLGLHGKADTAGTADNSNNLQGNPASAFANNNLSNVSNLTIANKYGIALNTGGPNIVGSVIFAQSTIGNIGAGNTVAGSQLNYSSHSGASGSPGVGTWMCTGAYGSNGAPTTFIRIY